VLGKKLMKSQQSLPLDNAKKILNLFLLISVVLFLSSAFFVLKANAP